MVNGGPSYHNMNAYFPIPYSHRLVQGSPNAGYPQLLPKFSLADGSELMPLVYMKDIELKGNTLSYRQEAFDRLGGNAPVRDERLKSDVRYELGPGSIRRIETYRAGDAARRQSNLVRVRHRSPNSRASTARGFGSAAGDVTELYVEGLQTCEAQPAEADSVYKAPHGPMKTVVRCHSDNGHSSTSRSQSAGR